MIVLTSSLDELRVVTTLSGDIDVTATVSGTGRTDLPPLVFNAQVTIATTAVVASLSGVESGSQSLTRAKVSELFIKNVDASVAQTVSVQLFSGGVAKQVSPTFNLSVGESCYYSEYSGWTFYDASGLVKPRGATTSIVNAGVQPSATTLTDVYTAPATIGSPPVANISRNISVRATNLGIATTVRVAVSPLGAAIANTHYHHYDNPLAIGESKDYWLALSMNPTDVVRCYSVTGNVVFHVIGTEESS